MNCTDFLRILWILMDFVHNPYRRGPLRVGRYAMAYTYMLGLSGSLPQSGGYDRQHVVWWVPVTEPTFSEPTVTKPIPRIRHPVRRHATEPTFTEPIFLAKLVILLIVVLQRVILQSPRLENYYGCFGLEFTNKT